jgi:hypothetical protein
MGGMHGRHAGISPEQTIGEFKEAEMPMSKAT